MGVMQTLALIRPGKARPGATETLNGAMAARAQVAEGKMAHVNLPVDPGIVRF